MPFFNFSKERNSKNPYAVLGVGPNADPDEANRAYRRLSLENQRGPNNPEQQRALNSAMDYFKKQRPKVPPKDVFKGRDFANQRSHIESTATDLASQFIGRARNGQKVSLMLIMRAFDSGKITREQFVASFQEAEEANIAALKVEMRDLPKRDREALLERYASLNLISLPTKRALSGRWWQR